MSGFFFAYLTTLYWVAKVLKINFYFINHPNRIKEQRNALNFMNHPYDLERVELIPTPGYELRLIMDHFINLASWMFNGYDEVKDLESLSKRIKSFSLFMANLVKAYVNKNDESIEFFKEVIPDFDHDRLTYLMNFKLIADDEDDYNDDDEELKKNNPQQVKDVRRFHEQLLSLEKINPIIHLIGDLIFNYVWPEMSDLNRLTDVIIKNSQIKKDQKKQLREFIYQLINVLKITAITKFRVKYLMSDHKVIIKYLIYRFYFLSHNQELYFRNKIIKNPSTIDGVNTLIFKVKEKLAASDCFTRTDKINAISSVIFEQLFKNKFNCSHDQFLYEADKLYELDDLIDDAHSNWAFMDEIEDVMNHPQRGYKVHKHFKINPMTQIYLDLNKKSKIHDELISKVKDEVDKEIKEALKGFNGLTMYNIMRAKKDYNPYLIIQKIPQSLLSDQELYVVQLVNKFNKELDQVLWRNEPQISFAVTKINDNEYKVSFLELVKILNVHLKKYNMALSVKFVRSADPADGYCRHFIKIKI